jgi:hypothetical protein
LANNAVTSVKIKDGTIVEADLANNAVTTGKIKDGTIVGSDISSSTNLNVGNVVASSFTYGSSQIRHWSASGAQFVPFTISSSFFKFDNCLYLTTDRFFTPVHIPNGAKVTKMKVYFWDKSGGDFTVSLFRGNLATGGFGGMATLTTTGTSTGIRTSEDTTINTPTIDNNQFTYRVDVMSMDGTVDHRLYGVVLEYEVTNPLP